MPTLSAQRRASNFLRLCNVVGLGSYEIVLLPELLFQESEQPVEESLLRKGPMGGLGRILGQGPCWAILDHGALNTTISKF